MDSSSIELDGSRIAAVETIGSQVKVVFEPAYIVKTMTGSVERTLWRQNGVLLFEQGEIITTELPSLPATCSGGDVGENIFIYRDMIPMPLASSGHAYCKLRLKDQREGIDIHGEGVQLVMEENAQYIKHIRPENGG